DGPAERAERHEAIARSREALQALKPAELRALTLLAEGYSYAEIGEITGFSQTKINRCLAEGRERFRKLVSRSEDGSRCEEMALLLSAFCDEETSAEETAAVREHLRACAGCRAAVRAYRTTPARVAALAPALPASHSLLERSQELLFGIQSRLPRATAAADGSVAQVVTAGGARGAGAAALAKLLAVCAGAVGGTAACVATGIAPVPAGLSTDRVEAPRIEQVSKQAPVDSALPAIGEQPALPDPPSRDPKPAAEAPEIVESAPTEVEAGAVEYTEPAPPPPASVEAAAPNAASGSAAGEFGP
ncbi:MAG TPA: zf-HC2 domain-containing protein, partial [Solirubrobacterales bacterium]|nr:zf-HC2 domain-containing protein [Solirubrobacterales bacterium]